MSKLPLKLRRLDAKLRQYEGLLLSELDGLLAGLIVCPEFIMPSEWWPCVWDREDDEDDPVFENPKALQETLRLVMEHYNQIITDLNAEYHIPIFDGIEGDDEATFWQNWASGFLDAVALRPAAWDVYMRHEDEVVVNAFSMLVTLGNISESGEDIDHPNYELLKNEALDLIPSCVLVLYQERLRSQQSPFAEPKAKPGLKTERNEPCPCGSGKKYKKCCGLN
ncbi:UPF0149 family protein [Asticcacaulis benevestitus]|uniref:YecA family protein n=1 Tax=Asticcacaulis benevestitus DSM 16100 = ATCC BAA-896 TaxID=1121022 RepID=V4PS47_9CAUL|nr:UPF0149 family protein [Asticcacaulis benevestitus]ESQ91116.1 hypothetical protein ABENE_10690 [Asticcacaulis benevestitus DSM 16100 = ATCC BAA-896]